MCGITGLILDVAVDIRHGSPYFGKWAAAEINAEAWNQIYIPVGSAYDFCTLKPDTEVLYKVSVPYAPEHDGGIARDGPDLAIDWPLGEMTPALSNKDRRLPRLKDLPELFHFKP